MPYNVHNPTYNPPRPRNPAPPIKGGSMPPPSGRSAEDTFAGQVGYYDNPGDFRDAGMYQRLQTVFKDIQAAKSQGNANDQINAYQNILDKVTSGSYGFNANPDAPGSAHVISKINDFLKGQISSIGQSDISSKANAFQQQFDTERSAGEQSLVQALTEQNKQEFETIFKPQIREALNARGILFGGAEQELGAQAKSGLEGNLLQEQQAYEAGTTEGETQIQANATQAENQLAHDTALTNVENQLSQANNQLMASLSSIASPSPLVGAMQGIQAISPFLYGMYQNGMFSGSGGSSGPAAGSGILDLNKFGFTTQTPSFGPPSPGAIPQSAPFATQSYKTAFGY